MGSYRRTRQPKAGGSSARAEAIYFNRHMFFLYDEKKAAEIYFTLSPMPFWVIARSQLVHQNALYQTSTQCLKERPRADRFEVQAVPPLESER